MLTFEDQQRYTHKADHVLSRYCDPGFVLARHEALGHQDVVMLEHTVGNDLMRMRVRFVHALDAELPEFVRRFAKKRTQIVQTMEWNRNERSGRIRVDAKGAPMRVEGSTRLDDCEGGCVASIRWELHCGIPLLGSKLEPLVRETMKRMTAEDQAVTQRLLAQAAAPRARAA